MAKYTVGDEIEAVKGKTRISGELELPQWGESLAVKDAGWHIDNLERDGFTIEVKHRAKPTKPGLYRGYDDDNQEHMGLYHTDGFAFFYLNADAHWVDIGWGQPMNGQLLERMEVVD